MRIRKSSLLVLVISFLLVVTSNLFGQAECSNINYSGCLNEPFNPNIEKLPVGFMGHSHGQVVQALFRMQDLMKKGEFETTEEYNRRDKTGGALFGSVFFDSTLAFVVLPGALIEVKYDADRQLMTIQPSGNWKGYQRGVNVAVRGRSEVTNGTTAFGGSVRMRVEEGQREPLLFPNRKDFEIFDWSRNGRDVRMTLSLPVSVAREVKDSIGLVFIGKLETPEIKTETSYNSATVNSPFQSFWLWTHLKLILSEVWIIDTKTGSILKRDKSKK